MAHQNLQSDLNMELARLNQQEKSTAGNLEKKKVRIQELEKVNREQLSQIDELMTTVDGYQTKIMSLELNLSKIKMQKDILQTERKTEDAEIEVLSRGYQSEVEKLSSKILQLKQDKKLLKQQILDLKLELAQKENFALRFQSPISNHPKKSPRGHEDLLNRTFDDVIFSGMNRSHHHLQIARERSSEKGISKTETNESPSQLKHDMQNTINQLTVQLQQLKKELKISAEKNADLVERIAKERQGKDDANRNGEILEEMHKDIKALAADNQRLNDTLIAKENEISFLISKNEKLELHLKTLEQIEVAFKEATSKLDSKTVELNSLKASLSNEKKKRSLDDDEKKKLDSLEQDFKKMRNKAEIAVKEAEQFKLQFNDAIRQCMLMQQDQALIIQDHQQLSMIKEELVLENERQAKTLTKLQMRLFLALTELDRMVEKVNHLEQNGDLRTR